MVILDKILEVRSVSKKYILNSNKKSVLKGILKRSGREFYALKNITFDLYTGDILGLIGLNGSGKSTLANLIAGVSIPSTGEINVKGEVSLLSIGLGLNIELTGIENIEYKLLLMGKKKKEIKELIPKIIETSELDDFIYQPVKFYSSGMRSKLGFSTAINVDPDLLIIDEALSVGDKEFAEKSFRMMKEKINSGKTIIFVSHSLPSIKNLCSKALWIDKGEIKMYGDDVNEVTTAYNNFKRNNK